MPLLPVPAVEVGVGVVVGPVAVREPMTCAPVDWVPLVPSFANLHPVGISVKAPHPNAARLFIDYVLSQRGQEIARALRRIPDRIDTPPDPPNLLKGITPAFTAPEIYDDFDRYIKLFQEIFATK